MATRASTSNGNEDFLARSLADWDIFRQLMTAREKLRGDTSNAQGHPIALVAKIGPRNSQDALVRKHIDEAEIDNIQRDLVTEMAQSGLVLPLALGQSVKATKRKA